MGGARRKIGPGHFATLGNAGSNGLSLLGGGKLTPQAYRGSLVFAAPYMVAVRATSGKPSNSRFKPLTVSTLERPHWLQSLRSSPKRMSKEAVSSLVCKSKPEDCGPADRSFFKTSRRPDSTVLGLSFSGAKPNVLSAANLLKS